ncbi:MAG: ABC transporter ATP-binding protein [Bifidobacteriaceae bacterium]|nr:ABC transporter ATP-binding protein [Bifidobacteriaceae bacterium]
MNSNFLGEVRNVSVDYTSLNTAKKNNGVSGQSLALNNVSFGVKAGESVAIMGPSGSGKTTLLHVMAGIINPTSGYVLYNGSNISALKDAQRTAMRHHAFGFVFQSGQLLPELPAVENIALPIMLNGVSYDQAITHAMQTLGRFGLQQFAQKRPGELSGGQMQRVAIARALCINPNIIFADEPTGALDQKTGHDVMGLLMQSAKENNASVIVVTHDKTVAKYCSRIVFMQDGRLFEQSPQTI